MARIPNFFKHFLNLVFFFAALFPRRRLYETAARDWRYYEIDARHIGRLDGGSAGKFRAQSRNAVSSRQND